MKKRKGPSFPKALRNQSTSFSGPTIIRRAREYPLIECWISADWKNDAPGLVTVVVARQQPDDNICLGMYLIDKLCLGLKNTFGRANYTHERYQHEAERIFQGMRPQSCPPDLAFQMIYGGIEYAAQFGFTPNKDFELTQNMLPPREEVGTSYQIVFGKKGKPLYINGPHDDTKAILRQLDMTAGPGNYDFVDISPSGSFEIV